MDNEFILDMNEEELQLSESERYDEGMLADKTVYINGGEEAVTLNRAYSFNLSLPTQNYDVITLQGVWAGERNPEPTPLRHGVISVDSKRASSSAINNPLCSSSEG